MNIVLIGMPGAGKSAAGRALSQMTGRKFVDTDEEIEAQFGSIPEIFLREGEDFFRAEEKKLCRTLENADGLVIATGGGTVLDGENLIHLKKSGTVVFLRAKCETLISRLKDGENRPLLQGDFEKNLRCLFEKRTPVYLKAADLVADTDALTEGEVAQKILEAMA